jgi:hypothetical protein
MASVVEMTEQEIITQALKLKAKGWGIVKMARHLGVGRTWLLYRIDPEAREKRRQAVRDYQSRGCVGPNAQVRLDAMKRLAEIPPDTRTASQKILGEPIFERSALFQKMQGGAG